MTRYTGCKELVVSDALIDEIHKTGSIAPPDGRHTYYPNMYVVLKSSSDEKKTALGRVSLADGLPQIKKISPPRVGKVASRNKEQAFTIDALLDPDITTVTLTGKTGSGKTHLALAAAMHLMDQRKYKKVILTKPMSQVGKYKLGALPGPQPLDAKLLTPNGWIRMGDVQIGQEIINQNGTPSKIIGIYPQGAKDIYQIATTDGKTTECCLDHLWYTQTAEEVKRQRPGTIKTTQQILDTLMSQSQYTSTFNHCLPSHAPVQFLAQKPTIPPYTLGVLLGEGSLGDGPNGHIAISNNDSELLDRVAQEIIQFGCTLSHDAQTISYTLVRCNADYNKTARPIQITNLATGEKIVYPRIGVAITATGLSRNKLNQLCKNKSIFDNQQYEFLTSTIRWTNPIKEQLYRLNLLGTTAPTKFIPKEFIYQASIADRTALLQGLMDSEGTVKTSTGEASFCTTSLQLANDVISLVRSLGGRATHCSRDRTKRLPRLLNGRPIQHKHISYEFTISFTNQFELFYITRKAQHYHPKKYLHKTWIRAITLIGHKETQCIKTDNPDHLYITDNYIVTHNTSDEKFIPFLDNYITNLEQFVGKDAVEDLMHGYKLEIKPIQLMRGASYEGALVIADEVQVLGDTEILTLGSRLGRGSKIILMGDFNQKDETIATEKTGLYRLINSPIAKNSPLVAVVELLVCERSPTATLFADVFEAA